MIIGWLNQTMKWEIAGAGASFESPVSLGSRPDVVTAIKWLSGAQTTSSVLYLRATWADAVVPGLLYLANTSLPVGTKIEVAWKRPADGGFVYQPAAYANPQRIVAGPRGERTCLIAMNAPGADAVIGCEVRIYNDVGGVASIVAGATHTIGALMPCTAAEVSIGDDWGVERKDATKVLRSQAGGVYAFAGASARTLSFGWIADEEREMFAAAGSADALLAQIDRGARAVYVPRYLTDAATYDAAIAHSHAMIGVMTRAPAIRHAAGPFFTASAGTVEELPVPA